MLCYHHGEGEGLLKVGEARILVGPRCLQDLLQERILVVPSS
jgi:hypothetical protein